MAVGGCDVSDKVALECSNLDRLYMSVFVSQAQAATPSNTPEWANP